MGEGCGLKTDSWQLKADGFWSQDSNSPLCDVRCLGMIPAGVNSGGLRMCSIRSERGETSKCQR